MGFTSEEIAFRDDVRSLIRDALPASIRHKMVEGRDLLRDDIVAWQRILNRRLLGRKLAKGMGRNRLGADPTVHFHGGDPAGAGTPPLAYGVFMVGP